MEHSIPFYKNLGAPPAIKVLLEHTSAVTTLRARVTDTESGTVENLAVMSSTSTYQ